MAIIFSNPKKTNLKYKNKLINSFKKTLISGNYINSKNVNNFEKNFSKYIGSKYCVGLGNATDALYLSLKMLDIKADDEVITPSHTAVGTVVSILNTGAKPIFVDVDYNYFTIDVDDLELKISKKTKAIILVHLYGQSCNIDLIKKISQKNKIPIIEDCSQASGAKFKNKKVGSFGEFGCFSFFPTKNLSCIGDGGAITFNNKKYLQKLISFREYGWDESRNLIHIGINSRLDEMHAGFLNVKLQHLNQDNNLRRKIANEYNTKIKNKKITLPKVYKDTYHVYHLYVIKVSQREKFIKLLKKNNIICGIHYPLPVHLQKYFSQDNKNLKLRNTEKLYKEIVSIPIYPELLNKDLNKIIKVINSF